MGQKVHPNGIRLGIVTNHKSVWYSNKKGYAESLIKDLKIRDYLRKKLKNAYASKIIIERTSQNVEVTVHTSRPGLIIGKKGEQVDVLRVALEKMLNVPVHINIENIPNAGADSYLVAANIAYQLERRAMFRKVMKMTMQAVIKCSGVEGVKIKVSGRLGGAEIARSEESRVGRVPLHTFRANIDYSASEAFTTYGIIGVKVWIFKGEVLDSNNRNSKISKSSSQL